MCPLNRVHMYLCEPTCDYYGLLVRALVDIVLLASLTSHIHRGRRDSFTHSLYSLIILIHPCVEM
jgi:hypothetical protein